MILSFSVLATFRTVFWSMFGRGDTDVVKLENYDNVFTEDIGYIIYGAYNISMVIVLLNMLIAMMTRSYQDITVSTNITIIFNRNITETFLAMVGKWQLEIINYVT